MSPKEFQKKYNLTDHDLAQIKKLCLMFNGTITYIGNRSYFDSKPRTSFKQLWDGLKVQNKATTKNQ